VGARADGVALPSYTTTRDTIRFDHPGRDAWKTQPVQFSDFQIVRRVHRSIPTATANRTAIPMRFGPADG
jgi:hypothetical protein